MPSRRSLLAAPLAILAAPRILRAQAGWPGERPIEVIVPYPPGGGVDIMARLVLQHLAPRLAGARFVVSNRVGAGGQIGTEAVFNAAPDGYTLGAIATGGVSAISLERPARWRIADFTYLANVVDDPSGFWVLPGSPLRSLADLASAARPAPERISVGTAAGIGSDDHQLLLAFEEAAGIRALHVPYNGTSLVIRDLLSGAVDVGSFNISEGLALLREGRIRCLGQASAERWAQAAEVPTFREQGFDVLVGSSRGFAGPPGLPEPIRTRLEAAFAALLADPAFLAEAERLGLPLRPLVGEAYRAQVLRDDAALRELFRRRPWGR